MNINEVQRSNGDTRRYLVVEWCGFNVIKRAWDVDHWWSGDYTPDSHSPNHEARMRSMEVRAHTLCGDTREPVRANLLGERYSTLRFANGAATTLSGGRETQYSIGLRHNKSPVSTTSMPVKPLKSLTCQDFNRTISYQIELRISSVSTQSRSPGDVLCPLGYKIRSGWYSGKERSQRWNKWIFRGALLYCRTPLWTWSWMQISWSLKETHT